MAPYNRERLAADPAAVKRHCAAHNLLALSAINA
jgi:hypothetical protein